jgi:hypothetical protein
LISNRAWWEEARTQYPLTLLLTLFQSSMVRSAGNFSLQESARCAHGEECLNHHHNKGSATAVPCSMMLSHHFLKFCHCDT